ncbi:MAG TPA: hypothetical protein DCG53_04755 [Syntrophus sp. (in: bacteria)]|nr:hypothetical protein [Syntrophus sp. (in: bacteria)]
MTNVAVLRKNIAVWPLSLAYGLVMEWEEDRYRIDTDDGASLWVRKAEGCLLQPDIGDRVLITADADAGGYILMVLDKVGACYEMVFSGEASLRTETGPLKLQADNVIVRGDKSVVLEAPDIEITGISGRVRFAACSLLASIMEVRSKRAVQVVDILDSVIGRVTERVRDSFRWIENLEQIRAGRIRTIVNDRFTVKAGHASLISEEEVAIDGKKIHIG